MLQRLIAIGITLFCLAGCSALKAKNEEPIVSEPQLPEAPVAKRIPHELVSHAHTRQDPYYWLRDDNRENPEILEYLRNENAYTSAVLASTEELQDKLFEEIKGRIKKDDSSVPYFLEGYWYYTRYAKGKEYPIHCRKPETLQNPEEIVLDVNEQALGHAYYSAVGLKVSEENNLLAFGEDTLSRRVYTLRFRNLTTGELLDEKVEGTAGSYAWAADNKTIF